MIISWETHWGQSQKCVCQLITIETEVVLSSFAEIMCNLSVPNYCYWSEALFSSLNWTEPNRTQLWLRLLHCTVHVLKHAPVASIIGWWLREPDWVSVVNFGGAPARMWTVPYLELFRNMRTKFNAKAVDTKGNNIYGKTVFQYNLVPFSRNNPPITIWEFPAQ